MYRTILLICIILFIPVNIYLHYPLKDVVIPAHRHLIRERTEPPEPEPLKPEPPKYCNRFPNVWANKDMEKNFLDILIYLNKLFMDNNIDYTIAFGTVLGYERHGDFIPWDDDLDIVIRKSDTKRARSLIRKPFCTHNFWGGWKLYKCDSPNAGKYNWKYPFVDVFDNGNSKSHKKSAYDNIIFPSKPANMHGLDIRIPQNVSKHLKLRYGPSYMRRCASPFWDHKNEKGIKHAKTYNCDIILENCF